MWQGAMDLQNFAAYAMSLLGCSWAVMKEEAVLELTNSYEGNIFSISLSFIEL